MDAAGSTEAPGRNGVRRRFAVPVLALAATLVATAAGQAEESVGDAAAFERIQGRAGLISAVRSYSAGLLERACARLGTEGSATVYVEQTPFEGPAVFLRGPQGELIVAMGTRAQGNPDHCLVLVSGGPVEAGTHEVYDPGIALLDEFAMGAAHRRLGTTGGLFTAADGQVQITELGDRASGRFGLRGDIDPGTDAEAWIEIRGEFEAVAD